MDPFTSLQPHPEGRPARPDVPKDPYAGVDLDLARRPGYGARRGIRPWPNARWPIEPQARGTAFVHGRSNKTPTPVFGTDAPPRGLSGRLRRLGYAYPDHLARHWLILLAADRVDLWERRFGKALAIAVPALLVGLAIRRVARR